MPDKSLQKRILLSLPLLTLFITPWLIKEASASLVVPYLYSFVEAGTWTTPRGDTLDLTESRLYLKPLDDLINPILAVFAPSMSGYDEVGRLQMLSFLMDVGPFFVILMFEKSRQRFSWTALLYPFAFALTAQLTGAGKLAGLFFFIEYLWAPVSSFPTAESTAIPKSAVIALPVAMLLVYYPLTLGSYVAPTLGDRARVNAYWQLYPFMVVGLHWGLVVVVGRARGGIETTTTTTTAQATEPELKSKPTNTKPQQQQQQQPNPRPELPTLTAAITLLSTLSAITFQYIRFSLPQSTTLLNIFTPSTLLPLPLTSNSNSNPSPMNIDPFALHVRNMLQYDELFWVAAGYCWLLLSFHDLRQRQQRGGVSNRASTPTPTPTPAPALTPALTPAPALWVVLLGLVLGTVVVGPGATFGGAWVVREWLWIGGF
ncbi:hypothetical protein BJX70DRAFT_17387 [Aspergillus crustosus]